MKRRAFLSLLGLTGLLVFLPPKHRNAIPAPSAAVPHPRHRGILIPAEKASYSDISRFLYRREIWLG